MVSGIVGQRLYETSDIDVKVKKTLFSDSKVIGYTTYGSINTNMDLTFTSTHFKANNNNEGGLVGTIKKSEFDWEIKQVGPNKYDIGRALIKPDHTLILNIENGKIAGELRRIMGFNWNIKGVYDSKGNVDINISAPLTLGIELEGQIVKR